MRPTPAPCTSTTPKRRPSTCSPRCSSKSAASRPTFCQRPAPIPRRFARAVDDGDRPASAPLRGERRFRAGNAFAGTRAHHDARPRTKPTRCKTTTSRSSTCLLAMAQRRRCDRHVLSRCRADAKINCSRRCATCAAISASRPRIPKARTSRSSATGATLRSKRSAANSIRLSVATKKSAASFKCSRAARKTIPCSSANPASARRRSSKDWRSASCAATFPKA